VKTIRTTPEYDAWFDGLRDMRAQNRIDVRIKRLSLGNAGDAKFFEGVGELRIDYGPGYRVYFVERSDVLLLCGGDKSTQPRDIRKAKTLAKDY
jgi:putative addiction module killer protein